MFFRFIGILVSLVVSISLIGMEVCDEIDFTDSDRTESTSSSDTQENINEPVDNTTEVKKFDETNLCLALQTKDHARIIAMLEKVHEENHLLHTYYLNSLVPRIIETQNNPIPLLEKLKELMGENFQQVKDQGLTAVAAEALPDKEIILFFLDNGGDATSGLMWYWYNKHIVLSRHYILHKANIRQSLNLIAENDKEKKQQEMTNYLKHCHYLARLISFNDFIVDPIGYTQRLLSQNPLELDKLKELCWLAALYNNVPIFDLLEMNLSQEIFTDLVNARSIHGLTALGYNALMHKTPLSNRLINLTKKTGDRFHACLLAYHSGNPLWVMLFVHLSMGVTLIIE